MAPVVSLDAKKYKLVQQLDAAFPGTPSLVGCDCLTVTGPVHFEGDIVFKVKLFYVGDRFVWFTSPPLSHHLSLPPVH